MRNQPLDSAFHLGVQFLSPFPKGAFGGPAIVTPIWIGNGHIQGGRMTDDGGRENEDTFLFPCWNRDYHVPCWNRDYHVPCWNRDYYVSHCVPPSNESAPRC